MHKRCEKLHPIFTATIWQTSATLASITLPRVDDMSRFDRSCCTKNRKQPTTVRKLKAPDASAPGLRRRRSGKRFSLPLDVDNKYFLTSSQECLLQAGSPMVKPDQQIGLTSQHSDERGQSNGSEKSSPPCGTMRQILKETAWQEKPVKPSSILPNCDRVLKSCLQNFEQRLVLLTTTRADLQMLGNQR
jgi:hypothetical protein